MHIDLQQTTINRNQRPLRQGSNAIRYVRFWNICTIGYLLYENSILSTFDHTEKIKLVFKIILKLWQFSMSIVVIKLLEKKRMIKASNCSQIVKVSVLLILWIVTVELLQFHVLQIYSP
jgi:hypothetical protein